jgi:hypothetical protein
MPAIVSLTRWRSMALAGALWLGSPNAAATQDVGVAADHARLETLLLEQASGLLERFGDTFYALGLYLGESGEPSGVSAREWPAFSAPPQEWADSLVAGMEQYRLLMRSAAYLMDEWRPVDPAGEARTSSVLHFETPAGVCLEQRWRFSSDADDRVTWTPEERLPCERRIWP